MGETSPFSPHPLPPPTQAQDFSVDLHEGRWGKEDPIVSWNFFLDEKAANNKVKVEDMDNKNKSITYITIERKSAGSLQELQDNSSSCSKGRGQLGSLDC
ncbi:hypothetical protein Pint_22312 [Pistacia integerrima]|uniref:Uncharacterized protein n=1 Tax=Pistacia integerrima TaxID=434235 RepID=A0ACC0YJX2_9ROSI|nr:hypothetical protein Pint_22312 [Pistacia integerrima]